jgi:hypothetical protein
LFGRRRRPGQERRGVQRRFQAKGALSPGAPSSRASAEPAAARVSVEAREPASCAG